MQCLANTGAPERLTLLLALAVGLVLTGAVTLWLARRSTATRTATLTAIVGAMTITLALASPQPARADDCPAQPPVAVASTTQSTAGAPTSAAPTSTTTSSVTSVTTSPFDTGLVVTSTPESTAPASTVTPTSASTSASTSAATTTVTTSTATSNTVTSSTVTSTTETSTATSTTETTPTSGTATPHCTQVNDKSPVLDADADGVVDACDLDSDNDGILDAEEDANQNGLFQDDDLEGDILIIPILGDGISTYLDLDSDNDGVLDLMEGRTFTRAQIDTWDTDHNGILDATLEFGTNGIADVLETAPDSGVLTTSLRNTDGDDKPDYLDLNSDGVNFDLYLIGQDALDDLGAGFISRISDADSDGIQAVVDTDLGVRGATGSPYSPHSS